MGNVLAVEKCGDITIVKILLNKIISSCHTQDVWEELQEVIGPPKPQILIDASGVSYIGSEMLGKLYAANSMIKRWGGTLKVCGLIDDILEVLNIMNINSYFQVTGFTVDDAISVW